MITSFLLFTWMTFFGYSAIDIDETVGLKRFDLLKWVGSGEGPQKKEDKEKENGGF